MAVKLIPTWQGKVKAAIRRDPKKTGVMTVLALVLAVLGGRAVVGGKAGPSPAPAGPLANGNRPADQDAGYKASGKKDVSAAMRRWLAAPSPKIGRNLFKMHLDYYPQLAGTPARPANSSDLDKSALLDADETREHLAALKAQAEQLKLQSTMMGADRQAMINGVLLRVGDTLVPGTADGLAGFRVLKVEPRRVTIGRGSVKLEIEMK